MKNRVSAEGGAMPSTLPRRAFLAGAVAVAATLPASGARAGQSAVLEALCAAHREAHAVFELACERLWATETAYGKAYGELPIVRSLLGGGFGMSNGEEAVRASIIAGYENRREGLKYLARLDPALAEQVRAVYDAKQAENMELVTRAFAAEAERRATFGLTAAEQEHQRADAAEDAAALAVCAHRCASLEEARLKAEYLATGPRFEGCDLTDKLAEALIRSFLPEGSADA